jgi:hypothetical protein
MHIMLFTFDLSFKQKLKYTNMKIELKIQECRRGEKNLAVLELRQCSMEVMNGED